MKLHNLLTLIFFSSGVIVLCLVSLLILSSHFDVARKAINMGIGFLAAGAASYVAEMFRDAE